MTREANHPKDARDVAGVGSNGKVSGRKAQRNSGAATTNAGGRKRLRPGELDGLVLAQMRRDESALPASPTTIAKALGRSSGAVGNCLERLAKAKKVRRAKKSPRAYDLKVTR